MAKEYDLVVLGGGTGGYVAAIRASQHGLKTAIVEKDKLGGTCLHKGCIPSKSLLRSAEVYRQSLEADNFGIELRDVSINFSKVQHRKEKVVDTLHNGVKGLVKNAKIDVFYGNGTILGPSIFSPTAGTVSVGFRDNEQNEMLAPKQLLIATGSKPKSIPGLHVDGKYILNSDDALLMQDLPESMVIVGGGVIGVEWASMLADFRVHVTIIETADRILTTEDSEISKEMSRLLQKKGIKIYTNSNILTETLDIQNSVKLEVAINQDKVLIEAEKFLISIGREANTKGIGLENTDIKLNDKGFIESNQFYQTEESHIYAIGDVIGGMQLAHVSSKEGIIAVDHIAGKNPYPLDYTTVPVCIYSDPEVASIGLTEEEAREKGYDIKKGKVSFKSIGKALVFGKTDGFVKIISDKKSNDLLGVHMIGPNVTDMISEIGLAKILDATAWEIGESIHPHPSLSEVIGEAALGVEGKKIHG